MRKLILIGLVPPPHNGQSIAFKSLMDYIDKDGVPYKVINIPYSFIPANKTLAILSRVFSYWLLLIQLFINCIFSKNVVYVQLAQSRNGFLRDVWINRIAKLFDSKIIGHLHGGNFNGFYESQSPAFKEFISKQLLKYDKLVVLSNGLKTMYSFQPIIQDRIIAIPNGTNKQISQPAKVIDNTKPIQILYLSNLIESKGYLHVLESLFFLKKENISFRANFCGEFIVNNDFSKFNSIKEARNNFFLKVQEYNLEKEVNYLGVVTGGEKEIFLEESNFFILPTQYINEGQPVSIIEAMRAGSVTIASNYRAIPEMIEHNKTGFLLKNISAKEIAGYIIYCVNNPDAYSVISKNAMDYYNENFTEEIHGKRMLALLKEYSEIS